MSGDGQGRPESPPGAVRALQEGCAVVPPRGGESCPVLRGEDELSARRGAGNVSSRAGAGKDCTYTPTKCLSPLNRWYTPTHTHINNGQLISSAWLSAAFYLRLMSASAASRALRLAWNGMIWDFSCRRRSEGFSRSPWVRHLQLLRAFIQAASHFTCFDRENCLTSSLSLFFSISLHPRCHCCDLYLSPSVLHDGSETCTAASSL